MKEEIDTGKVFLAIVRLKQNVNVESIQELYSKGLEGVCDECGVDINDMSEEEKHVVWYELIKIVEEIEFCIDYWEIYSEE